MVQSLRAAPQRTPLLLSALALTTVNGFTAAPLRSRHLQRQQRGSAYPPNHRSAPSSSSASSASSASLSTTARMAIEGPMSIGEILSSYQGHLPGWAAMNYYINHHAADDAFLAAFAVVGTHFHREKWGESYEEYLEMQAAAGGDVDGDENYDDEYYDGYYDFGFDDDLGLDDDGLDGGRRRRRRGPRRRAPMDRRLPPARDYEEPW